MTPHKTPETRSHGALFAIALILAGVLLFLDNLGMLPSEYWGLLLVAYGVWVIYRRRSAVAVIWACTVATAGVLLVLGSLGILPVPVGSLWPLLLIALGAMMLVDRSKWGIGAWPDAAGLRMRRRERWKRRAFAAQAFRESSFPRSNFADSEWARNTPQEPFSPNKLNEVAVFFGIKRRFESQSFEGGELVAVFGSVDLDLTDALIQLVAADGVTERVATLNASAVFGGIEIGVPRGWRVLCHGAGIFGSYEDKTIPRPESAAQQQTLIIRGGAVFGSVTVKN